MATTVSSGTQSATGDHSLANTTTAGTYQCQWNLTNMANGDQVELYVTTKVLSTDTEERIYSAFYQHDQGNTPIIHSPPIVSMHSLTMYVKELGASTISVPWALIKIA